MTSPMLWATRGATATLALAFTSAVAAAQQAPAPAPAPANDETIHGTVDSLPEHYTLILKDARGFVDTVTLRDDTVVNPANLELTSGLTVTIHGHTSGKTFVADEVDGPQDAASGDAVPQAPPVSPPAPPQYAQPDPGYDAQQPDGPYDGPAYDAPPAYGYDEAPDVIYGAPYVGPAFGIVIGGGYGYYGGPYGYYGGPYGYGYGGYYGPGYYHGYPGGYHYPPGTSAPVRTPLPIRRAPGSGYPTGSTRSGYSGSTYSSPGYSGPTYRGYSSYAGGSTSARSYAAPSRSYAAPSSAHVSSSSHGSSGSHR